ncbi:MAG: MATE family efflux transporter [Clostridia bacterium]|nr:MATE family efflux transporter [Clostridia bacterium]MBR1684664.1 MATE family efflux transporter [Clostridia bacterium]MBR2288486.1 MATE family efflux transporter [Clostridia bacterium]
MSRTSTRDLTQGNPMKLILGFAAPLLFGFLFQQFYSFVDTAIVGKYLGAAKLAAVGDTGSINFLVLGFCQGACAGFAIPIAQAFGAKDEHEMRRCVAASVYLSAFLSILMAILTSLLCPVMLRAMNTPEEIIADSVAYIRIIFMGIPVTILYNMASGILRSLGDSKTPVFFLILASLVNVVLDLFFIIYVKMDVAGAAVATLISQLVSGVGCILVMVRRFPMLRLSSEERRPDPALMKSLLLTGLPMGLQYSITAIGSVIVQWSVNGLGVDAVAAIAAASKLSMFFACVFDALSTTMATYAGQNMGARKVDRIDHGLRDAAIIGTIYCIAAFLVILLLGPSLLGLFINRYTDPEVMRMATTFIRMNGAFYIPLLFVNILRLSIQGMGYTKIAMIAGVFEMVARTLVAVLLVPVLGFTGACLANPAAWIMADLFLVPCYIRVIRAVRMRLHVPGRARTAKEAARAHTFSRRLAWQHGRNFRHAARH